MEKVNPNQIVDKFKTKYPEGFTKSEITELLKEFPNINMKFFNEALFVITAPVINDETIIYPWDVKQAIICGLENRNLNEHEID